ncbi:MAG: NlpC/P60 family protein [Actinobacteria bacterium]|nr:NlpC/P60 family protein [Actinomycetota bacterium]
MPGYSSITRVPRRRLTALVMLVLLLVLCGTGLARASTPAIDKTKTEVQALSALLDQLDQQLGAVTEDYNYAQQQLDDTKAAVKKTSAELKQAQKDLTESQERLNQRVVHIYKSGKIAFLGVLLDANSFRELISRFGQLTRLSEQDNRLVKQIQQFKAQTADRKAKLDARMQEQKAREAETAAARQKVLDQVEVQKKALAGKETQLAQLRKEEAARQAKLAEEARKAKIFAASRPGRVIKMAMSYLGVPYVWGGSSPGGFDCSGLVQYVYAKVGISLPHSSRMQFNLGTPVSYGQLKAGDLVFFFTPIQHVGIYIGSGRMINATGNQVQISDVWPSSFRGGRRVF